MDVFTYGAARAKLKQVMDRVVADRQPVVVTRRKAEAVVMLSLAEWNAMEETLRRHSTPANTERPRRSIRELDAGMGQERNSVDA